MSDATDSFMCRLLCCCCCANEQDGEHFDREVLIEPEDREPEVDYKSMLRQNFHILSRCLVVSQCLLFRLDSIDSIKDKLATVDLQQTSAERTATLMRILCNLPNDQLLLIFSAFLFALRQDGQEHVANIFQPESDARPMSEEHYQLLLNRRGELCQFMDTLDCLLDKLVHQSVFTETNREAVQCKIIFGYSKMSAEVVNILLRKPDSAFDKFISILNGTGQQHVAYILTGQGEPPMSTKRIQIFKIVRVKLIINLETQHCPLLMEKLFEFDVLNCSEKQRIVAQPTCYRKNIALLDVIAQKSNSAFDKFLTVLRDEHVSQAHIAMALEGMDVDSTLHLLFRSDTTSSDKTKIMEAVRSHLCELFSGSEIKCDIASLMKRNGFIVDEICPGSIHIIFRCFTEESLVNLERLYTDKTLDNLFTQALSAQFAHQGLESLTLNITDDELRKSRDALREMALMSREHHQTLQQVAETDSAKVLVSVDLLNKLRLCRCRKEAVLAAVENSQRMKTLFDIVSCQPDREFTQFINALRETGQDETADYIDRYTALTRSPGCTVSSAVTAEYQDPRAKHSNLNRIPTGQPEEHSTMEKIGQGTSLLRPRLLCQFTAGLLKPSVAICAAGEVIVSSATSGELAIFSFDTSQQQQQLQQPISARYVRSHHIERPVNISDLAVCQSTMDLFAIDEAVGIQKIQKDGKIEIFERLHGKSLSVTPSGRLLVTRSGELELASPAGKSVCLINLRSYVNYAKHALEVGRDTFVVCYSSKFRESADFSPGAYPSGIALVDCQGKQLLRSFGDKQGPPQLSYPSHIARVGRSGRILVADTGNRRIVLLNSTSLELEGILVTAGNPYRLSCHEESGQLAVAMTDGNINIYDIKDLF